MNPKKLREKWGLTQADMAILLDLGRSHYSMVEIRQRKLDPHHITYLQSLDEAHQDLNSELGSSSRTYFEKSEMAADVDLAKKIRRYEKELEERRAELAAMKKMHVLWVQTVKMLEEEMNIRKSNKTRQDHLKKMHARMLQKAASSAPKHQQILAAEIKSLEAFLNQF